MRRSAARHLFAISKHQQVSIDASRAAVVVLEPRTKVIKIKFEIKTTQNKANPLKLNESF